MKKALIITSLFAICALASCSKKNEGGTPDLGPSKNGSEFDLIRDSIFLYAKEVYYWYDALPQYADFKPRSYTGSTDFDALEKEVNAISQFKINPVGGKPYEYNEYLPGTAKYSYIDGGESSTELGGAQSNFGFAPLYEDRNDLRIKFVYPGSAADLAGIKRGYRIMSINGRTNIAYDGDGSGANVQFVINAYAYSNNITMVLQKPDLTTFTVNLLSTAFTTNPVLTYKILNTDNGRKVGYFVFNSFTAPANATPKLDQVFNYFSSNGVTDLVVDLRYNGGGYVSTAEYLCNLIAPASSNNTVMYNTFFNSILTSGKASILANQVRRDKETNQVYNYGQFDYSVAANAVKFSKKGTLNITGNVFFIVGGGTASASELVINNLRPVTNVKLIGTTTYGKPVGFFDIRINKYEMYIPEFETKNSLGQGGYFTGMTPGTVEYPGKEDYDDVTRDFGDPNETLLRYALNYVTRGTYAGSTLQVQGLSQQRKTFSIAQSASAAQNIDAPNFSGMIYDKTPPRK